MRRAWLGLCLGVVAAALLAAGCGDSGCGEGFREYNGECVPVSDSDSDGDVIIVPPSDRDVGDGDGDAEEAPIVVTGSGSCGDPFVYPSGAPVQGSGMLADRIGDVSGAACFDVTPASAEARQGDGDEEDETAETDGDEEAVAGPGKGPEVAVKLSLGQGDQVTVEFGAASSDAMIYILQGECGPTAECSAIIDNVGPGLGETLLWTVPLTGDYVVVLDTRSEEARGEYSFDIKIVSAADGDADGDAAEDGDQDGDDAPVETFIGVGSSFPVPDSAEVPGAFTDLTWKMNGENPQVILLNDSGQANWTRAMDSGLFGDALFTPTAALYRGVVYLDGAQPVYLDATAGKITDPTHGDVVLPGDFGPRPSGLAYLNGAYWATEGTTRRLFNFYWSDEGAEWRWNVYAFPSVTDLAGVTAAEGRLFVLDHGVGVTRIIEVSPETGGEMAIFQLGDEELEGIAYDSFATMAMWGVRALQRDLVRLVPFGGLGPERR
ncbi:MAG: hypothetical protein C4523_12615 [Myxococcales bacterium]|nr:MAG: hypothetical protein C4523_12615 [Myxococcales bacterium]